eukprot:TRINITY_DN601_c0_g1_i1.p1 TRINITY_DN601_c0_g1~~TRINITY_DN601_c0_g1_i1.p1  ORF type:complete len:263 (-),score=46.56 TRINITY_DN601_c0_g1_i1:638-1426(-)
MYPISPGYAHLRAYGSLFAPCEAEKEEDAYWHWPYNIISYLPGTPLRELIPSLTDEMYTSVAKGCGKIVRDLHSIPIDNEKNNGHFLQMNIDTAFRKYLSGINESIIEIHTVFANLPPHLINNLLDYLPDDPTSLFNREDFVYIHNDINCRHVICEVKENALDVTGIIDFDDAMIGDWLYELVALFISSFSCRKELLKAFLKEYGAVEWSTTNSYTLMCYTLYHKPYVLETVFSINPSWTNCGTLDELEKLLWDLEDFNTIE